MLFGKKTHYYHSLTEEKAIEYLNSITVEEIHRTWTGRQARNFGGPNNNYITLDALIYGCRDEVVLAFAKVHGDPLAKSNQTSALSYALDRRRPYELICEFVDIAGTKTAFSNQNILDLASRHPDHRIMCDIHRSGVVLKKRHLHQALEFGSLKTAEYIIANDCLEPYSFAGDKITFEWPYLSKAFFGRARYLCETTADQQKLKIFKLLANQQKPNDRHLKWLVEEAVKNEYFFNSPNTAFRYLETNGFKGITALLLHERENLELVQFAKKILSRRPQGERNRTHLTSQLENQIYLSYSPDSPISPLEDLKQKVDKLWEIMHANLEAKDVSELTVNELLQAKELLEEIEDCIEYLDQKIADLDLGEQKSLGIRTYLYDSFEIKTPYYFDIIHRLEDELKENGKEVIRQYNEFQKPHLL